MTFSLSRPLRGLLAAALVAGSAYPALAASTLITPLPIIPASQGLYKTITADVEDKAGPWGASSRDFSMRLAESIFLAVNAERQKNGLRPVSPEYALARAAGGYAGEMITGGFFGHYDPSGRGLRNRLEQDGVTQFEEVAENLWQAEGRVNWIIDDNTQRAVRDWLNSDKGHREAMLDPNLQVAGVGVALRDERVIVSMMFGRN